MPKLSVFQTVLLAVFGALAVSGVLIFALVVGGGGGNSVGPVIIWGTLEEGAFRAVIRQISENNDTLSQVTYIAKDEKTYASELTEALASGAGPDLFLMRQDYAVRDAGKVLPIPFDNFPETQFRNAFIEAANPFIGTAGILAVPFLADPLVLYWNRDMLSSAGFANPPRYWDELNGMVQAITVRDDAGQVVKSAVSFGEYRNVTHAKDILATLILQAGSSITAKDSAGRLVPALAARTGDRLQAADSALRFYTEFADPSKASYTWSRALSESRAAFAAGELALYIGYSSEKPIITRTNPNLNFAVAPMPQIRAASGEVQRAVNTAWVYGFATTRTTKNPQGAFIVASTLAARDVSLALSTVYGIPSARRDVLTPPGGTLEGDDLFKFSSEQELFNKQAIISRAWTDPDPDRTNEVFRAMIENVTTGALRLSEAVQRAHQEMGNVLGI